MLRQRGEVAAAEPRRVQVRLFAGVRGVGAVGRVVRTGCAKCMGTARVTQQRAAAHVNVRVGAVLHRLGLWSPGGVAAGRHRGIAAVIVVVASIGTVIVVVVGVNLRRSVVPVVSATATRQAVSITSSIATGVMISAIHRIVSSGPSRGPIVSTDTVTTTVMRGSGGEGRTKRRRTAYSASQGCRVVFPLFLAAVVGLDVIFQDRVVPILRNRFHNRCVIRTIAELGGRRSIVDAVRVRVGV